MHDKEERMRATVTIDKDKLEILMKETKSRSKASAVRIAIDEYLRKKKIEKIKSMKGRMEFTMTADEIRHRER
jgi:predicted ribonuclease YlaK